MWCTCFKDCLITLKTGTPLDILLSLRAVRLSCGIPFCGGCLGAICHMDVPVLRDV